MSDNRYNSSILVVDDNDAVRDLLAARLEDRGYRVATAADGQEAVYMVRQRPFDLVLLDIMMPEMNGYEVLAQLKTDPALQHIPIIVLSALNDINNAVKCIEIGAEDFLFKPINSALLWARITTSLEKKHLRDTEHAYLEELALLQKIDRELNASLNLNDVARITLNHAVRQTKADGGLFVTLDDNRWRVLAARGTRMQVADALLLATFEVEISTHNGRVHHEQLEGDEGFIAGAQHRLIAHIQREGSLVGVLLLESRQPYDDQVFLFLARLTDHVAIALNNAQLYTDIQAANRAKSDFVAMVSHELKTPLTAILTYSDLMVKKFADVLPEKQDRYLKAMKDGTSRMINLVEELDDITRLETNRLRLEQSPVSLPEVIDEVLQLFSPEFESRRQTVSVDLPADLPPLWADRQRLVQIVTNLLSNAGKYSLDRGRIQLTAQLVGKGLETAVQVAVADNGIGIQRGEQSQIFKQFFRSSDVQVREIRGAGLGLNITKRIVEMHGGEIWFESSYGEGTTFYFTMPVVETAVAEPLK